MGELATIEPGPGLQIMWELDEIRAGLPSAEDHLPWRVEGEVGPEHSALRVLTATTATGAILLLAAARPSGADGHDSEEPRAILVDSKGKTTQIEEALVSTQYARDGSIARLGLELYAEGDDYPLRCAGDAEATTRSTDGHLRRESAVLAFRLDGEPGTALYDILHV